MAQPIETKGETKTLWFITWVLLSVVVGMVASNYRNRNGFGWFLLAFIVSPLIAGLLVLATKPLDNTPRMTRRQMIDRLEELKRIDSREKEKWKNLRSEDFIKAALEATPSVTYWGSADNPASTPRRSVGDWLTGER